MTNYKVDGEADKVVNIAYMYVLTCSCVCICIGVFP